MLWTRGCWEKSQPRTQVQVGGSDLCEVKGGQTESAELVQENMNTGNKLQGAVRALPVATVHHVVLFTARCDHMMVVDSTRLTGFFLHAPHRAATNHHSPAAYLRHRLLFLLRDRF